MFNGIWRRLARSAVIARRAGGVTPRISQHHTFPSLGITQLRPVEQPQERQGHCACLRRASNFTNAEAHAVAGVLRGCISDALAALGAEEAK
jgi:hypothetical protein